ncbi:hypothetical protein HG531_011387 [Fusarium graminearum]|nr:hypothetical protein HG531_011387 [Fusarium graminearum]
MNVKSLRRRLFESYQTPLSPSFVRDGFLLFARIQHAANCKNIAKETSNLLPRDSAAEKDLLGWSHTNLATLKGTLSAFFRASEDV